MRLRNRNHDQRKSSRHPVPESRQRCEVKIEGEILPAWLLDESAGGFAVLVSSVGAEILNQRIELRVDGMYFDVRVAHVAEVVPKTSVSGKGPWFRLGLCCMNEIESAESPEGSTSATSVNALLAAATHWVAAHLRLSVVTVALPAGTAVGYWLMR